MPYDHRAREAHWQERWRTWGVHHFDPRSKAPIFSIDNPPRYASGALHLGHATGYTQIDFVARHRRLKGDNVLFPLCADVNGMPIEVAVEKKHKVSKRDTDRQTLIRLCTEFADSNIQRMIDQFTMLGHSMDETQYYRTDSPQYRAITQKTFLRIFAKGYVYKKEHPVTWCGHCGTALAAADVEYEERSTQLCTIPFARTDGGTLEVATTRPELICACQAVLVNPDDPRGASLVGTTVSTPLYGKQVPVLADPDVDLAFGSGAVMVCSFGDRVDLEWLQRHRLPMQDPIDRDGKMTSLIGPELEGSTILHAREQTTQRLRSAGLLLQQRPTTGNVGCCWRCGTPVEFLRVPQWFIRSTDLRQRVKDVAAKVQWFPPTMRVRLENWADSLAWDWCVSRQRYFATAIPLWECSSCAHVVPATEEQLYVDPTVDAPPVAACPACGGTLEGCKDVFDTWVDSSITAEFITYWERDRALFERLWPTSLRPQSHDIIRTWAFYTLLRAVQLFDAPPWEQIMITGFIMAPDGTPMHTSKGNVVDPVPLVERHGADAFRTWAANCSLGVDHAFQEKVVVHGSRLVQKAYNALSYAGEALEGYRGAVPPPAQLSALDRWVLHRFGEAVDRADEALSAYRFDQAIRELEQFLWHEFADHYLESIKPRVALLATGTPDPALQYTLATIGTGTLAALSVFLPHVCEEVYQNHFRRFHAAPSVGRLPWPKAPLRDEVALQQGERLKAVLAALRHWRSEHKLKRSDPIAMVELVTATPLVDLAILTDVANITQLRTATVATVDERAIALRPDHKLLGPAFRGAAKEVIAAIEALPLEVVAAQIAKGQPLTVALQEGRMVDIPPNMVQVISRTEVGGQAVEVLQAADVQILLWHGAG